jgi:phage-related protein
MTTMHSHFRKWPMISGLSAFFLCGVFAAAQTAPVQTTSQNNTNTKTSASTGSTQDRDITRRELANFDEFLDSHREIAEQVRKDPSLLDNKQFLKDHPQLQTYLWNHPGVREEVKENPTVFMHAENHYEHAEDAAAREATHEKLASFDQFLDKHREIAEQVRKNPSLLDNQQFLKDHPELQTYLQDHTGVRNAARENPSEFMQQEDRYNRLEAGTGDADAGHRQFGEFLGAHSNIARDLNKDASLVRKDEYMHSHPELQEYLSAHAEVRQQLMDDPQGFVKSCQQFTVKASAANPAMKTTAQQPKP